MRGATAPRLLLELICARVLLPGADHTTEGVLARLDRLERRLTIAPVAPGAPIAPGAAAPPARRTPEVAESAPVAEASPVERPAEPATPAPTTEPASAAPTQPEAPPEPQSVEPEPEPVAAPVEEAVPVTTAAGSTLTLVDVRRLWPDIVEATKQRRRVTWIHLTQQAQVIAVDDKILTLGFGNAGARDSFDNGGSAEIVRQAAIDVVGHDWRVETIVDPGAKADLPPPPPGQADVRSSAPPTAPVADAPAVDGPPDWAQSEAGETAARPPAESASPAPTERQPNPSAEARQAISTTRTKADDDAPAEKSEADGGARPDDIDAESDGLDGAELLQQALGAQVIEEIPHS
jgi:DNA polymerase III subunit gamma/tau